MAAKAAGMACVAVPNAVTRHVDLTQADLVVDSLTHLSFESLSGLVA
jgi:beta-phosphoglucomutase-like phosphatase (HAD superfamily)